MINIVVDRLLRVKVNLVKLKQLGITKTTTICSQTLYREFIRLVYVAKSGVCSSKGKNKNYFLHKNKLLYSRIELFLELFQNTYLDYITSLLAKKNL